MEFVFCCWLIPAFIVFLVSSFCLVNELIALSGSQLGCCTMVIVAILIAAIGSSLWPLWIVFCVKELLWYLKDDLL